MCGIVGALDKKLTRISKLSKSVQDMASAISYRGPDDSGIWSDEKSGIALGHRRLSIVDLSSAGHQPMHSASGRYVLVFNGEIYNHLEIRSELDALGASPNWRGHSDTETLLAGFERWGIVPTLTRTIGMFAFALWDVNAQTLHLARDRFGEKPLYYGWTGNNHRNVMGKNNAAFIFGSELKALRAYPGFSNKVSRSALANYLRFLYVPAPESIYQDIYKLEPGCILSVSGQFPGAPSEVLRAPVNSDDFTLQRWWSLASVVESGSKNLITDEVEAVLQLEQSLREAVRLQSQADVPLGAFLSGGIDSSTIVALMQEQSMRPIKTFTVGFEESGFDESPYAKKVAQHLGADHSELFMTAAEAQAVIPLLAAMYDEPFADSSQIPTYLVCKAARKEVTVALSGDAGDELFGGYNRYLWGRRIWNHLAWLPYSARKLLGSIISTVPIASWDACGVPINMLLGDVGGIDHIGDKAHKLAARLSSVNNPDDLYWSLVSEWQDPAKIVLQEKPSFTHQVLLDPKNIDMPSAGLQESQLRMMFLDSVTYLPGDILCKVDRAAMATSLETRIPFLDHRVAEFAWRLPLEMKIRGNEGKWALRQVLYKYVPRELIERPKAGFGIPLGQWLRGPLKEWAEELLSESTLRKQGYFNVETIAKKWQEHLSGRRDHTASLWAILMFQSWIGLNT
jgi:asparagine synthase (glutamine-hydrolysing)